MGEFAHARGRKVQGRADEGHLRHPAGGAYEEARDLDGPGLIAGGVVRVEEIGVGFGRAA